MSQYSFSLPREFYRYIHFFGLLLTCKIVHSSQNNIAVEKLDFASLQHSFWLDLWSSEKAKYELLYHMLNIQIGVCACVCVCWRTYWSIHFIASLQCRSVALLIRSKATHNTTSHHIAPHNHIISYHNEDYYGKIMETWIWYENLESTERKASHRIDTNSTNREMRAKLLNVWGLMNINT